MRRKIDDTVFAEDADQSEQSNLDILKERFMAHGLIDPAYLIAVLNDLSGIENAKPEEVSEEANADNV